MTRPFLRAEGSNVRIHCVYFPPLAESSAQKLVALPGSRGPVWPVLSCLVAEGVKRQDGAEKTIVVAMRKLASE